MDQKKNVLNEVVRLLGLTKYETMNTKKKRWHLIKET